jgi:methionyl-tRNA synthetase
MCDMCQMQFRHDHLSSLDFALPYCGTCGKFRVDDEEIPECYHCFALKAELDPCDMCEHEKRRAKVTV